MVLKVFDNDGAVYVRGQQVHMSVKAINKFYGLDTDNDHVDWEAHNPKCNAYSEALAQELGTIGQPTRTSCHDIRNNLPINIGYLIRQSITIMGKVGSCKLCFPSLITHFCAAAGVDAYGRDEIVIPPPPNLDWHRDDMTLSLLLDAEFDLE
ncbi:hypothetical protein ACOSP7_004500 [Xanthoceras sorbifolium]